MVSWFRNRFLASLAAQISTDSNETDKRVELPRGSVAGGEKRENARKVGERRVAQTAQRRKFITETSLTIVTAS